MVHSSTEEGFSVDRLVGLVSSSQRHGDSWVVVGEMGRFGNVVDCRNLSW